MSVAIEDKIEVIWNYNDVYNQFSLTAEEKALDATNLCNWVSAWKERGRHAAIHINETGQLECVFFAMPKAVEFWAKSPNDNVLLYDTTFSTNRCGMKLGCGTGVNEEGLSNILFVSLVSYQDSDAFQWVFEEMMKAFHTAAAVIFTDSDPAMAIAIVTVLAPNGTKHFLCTWHLSKNFVTNMKGTAGTAWRDIEDKWWRICKETSFDSRATFDAEWEELTSLLPSVDPSNQAATKTRDNSLKWLDSLKDKKEKWAARWTWATFTAGVHSMTAHKGLRLFTLP